MKLGRHTEREPMSGLTVALGGMLLLGLAYVAVTSIPEVVRYLRIRRM